MKLRSIANVVGSLVVAYALTNCSAEKNDPEEFAVTAFFAAASGKDCERVKKWTAKPSEVAGKDGRCEKFLRDFADHKVTYEGTRKVLSDGRNPEARLVETTMAVNGHERSRIVRLEKSDGRWKVASF